MTLPSKEELLNSEDVRIQVVQEEMEEWGKLGERMHTEYAGFLAELHRERREMIKYLGTIAGGAAVLAPQLLDKAQHKDFFYIGFGLLCMVVVISVTYILSTVENEVAILVADLKDKNEMLDRIKKPKRNFLMRGDYGVDAFREAMSSGAIDEMPKIRKEIEDNKARGNGWYKPMDYTGEFIIWFFVLGIALLALGLTNINVSLTSLFWVSIAIFVAINFFSTFPIHIFKILGSPIDLVKSLIRCIFKKY
jgi:hypothetical protein